jgi:hypothetical protein
LRLFQLPWEAVPLVKVQAAIASRTCGNPQAHRL